MHAWLYIILFEREMIDVIKMKPICHFLYLNLPPVIWEMKELRTPFVMRLLIHYLVEECHIILQNIYVD